VIELLAAIIGGAAALVDLQVLRRATNTLAGRRVAPVAFAVMSLGRLTAVASLMLVVAATGGGVSLATVGASFLATRAAVLWRVRSDGSGAPS